MALALRGAQWRMGPHCEWSSGRIGTSRWPVPHTFESPHPTPRLGCRKSHSPAEIFFPGEDTLWLHLLYNESISTHLPSSSSLHNTLYRVSSSCPHSLHPLPSPPSPRLHTLPRWSGREWRVKPSLQSISHPLQEGRGLGVKRLLGCDAISNRRIARDRWRPTPTHHMDGYILIRYGDWAGMFGISRSVCFVWRILYAIAEESNTHDLLKSEWYSTICISLFHCVLKKKEIFSATPSQSAIYSFLFQFRFLSLELLPFNSASHSSNNILKKWNTFILDVSFQMEENTQKHSRFPVYNKS